MLGMDNMHRNFGANFACLQNVQKLNFENEGMNLLIEKLSSKSRNALIYSAPWSDDAIANSILK